VPQIITTLMKRYSC